MHFADNSSFIPSNSPELDAITIFILQEMKLSLKGVK